MNGLLVDTSVWVDLFRGKITPSVNQFELALKNRVDIYICGLIKTEILQGINTDSEYVKIKRILDVYGDIPIIDSSYILAADIYRKGRAKGITVRKTIDCIIAALAIENKLELLHNDKDFIGIEAITTLKVHK